MPIVATVLALLTFTAVTCGLLWGLDRLHDLWDYFHKNSNEQEDW